MAKIANGSARPFVQACKDFQGANLYAVHVNGQYVVYSYGEHWPLFIYDPRNNTWFENADKYGCTTSKHHGQAHPHCETVKLFCKAMIVKVKQPTLCAIKAAQLANCN